MRPTQGGRPEAPSSLQSVSVLVHPDQVLHHPSMSLAEKRALLSSWASDSRAVESAPALRRLDSGATIPVDEILAALASLPDEVPPSSDWAWTSLDRRQRPFLPSWRKVLARGKGGLPPRGGGAAALRLAPAVNLNA